MRSYNKRTWLTGWIWIWLLGLIWSEYPSPKAASNPQTPLPQIFLSPKATGLEHFAARELRRYLYLRTGQLTTIHTAKQLRRIPAGGALVVGTKDSDLLQWLFATEDEATRLALSTLGPQEYWLKTLIRNDQRIGVIAGGDPVGCLYGAYRYAYHLGVRFYLHGDVIPDKRIDPEIPILDEPRMPLFEIRGILPYHDFPEGPDWWNRDGYLAVVAQLPKLGMNFIGLHTYPEGHPNAEPTVWIGLPEDVGPYGQVKTAYPASYFNTLRGNWGYAPRKTSEYSCGSGQLFDRDAYGNEVMQGLCPHPKTPQQCQELFQRTGQMLNAVFRYAHKLGIQTCVGTQTPLLLPKTLQQHLQALGLDPKDRKTRRRIYEGIFHRIQQTYPIDYYWLWTTEGWTWQGNTEQDVLNVLEDIGIALEALRRTEAPFHLATCGWVLGPQEDRAKFGRLLPSDVAISSLNRQVGMDPVDPAYAEISGHPKWAIPWLEDDPGLTMPQLWVGRMRKDAADARRYGCTGLIGIHWRTRAVGPNVAALAEAAWDQSGWNPTPFEAVPLPARSGPLGGRISVFPTHEIAGTDEDPIYQTVRYDFQGYYLAVANGRWRVTLKFCEPFYNQPGKRVFGVKIQGRPVVDRLDIYKRVGKDHALDLTFDNILVTNGWLSIEFVPIVEYPCIAGIVAEGPGRPWKINCGGSPWRDYLGDWPEGWRRDRFVPSEDFYTDWATTSFGPEVGPEVGKIFAELDGRLPRPAAWVRGPGGLRPDPRPWEEVAPQYEFVSWLEALAPKVKGQGNRARFHYWLESFRYLRAMAHLRCVWYELIQAMDAVRKAPADQRATLTEQNILPRWKALLQVWREVHQHLLAFVSTTGGLGTIANWEQHIRPNVLDQPMKEIQSWLGKPLPPDARIPMRYEGPMRVFVPEARTSYGPAEPLTLRILVLSQTMPRSVTVYWRRMGRGMYQKIPAEPINRGVYRAQFPPLATAHEDLEYYVEAVGIDGTVVRWPETAPQIPQTMIRMPLPSSIGE